MILMTVQTLTKQLIKSITCPAGKHKIDVYDSRCKGLLLEVRSTGGKTFYFRFRNDRGKLDSYVLVVMTGCRLAKPESSLRSKKVSLRWVKTLVS